LVRTLLAAVLAVVCAVVVQADHRFVVSQIDERLVDTVTDPDLGSRPW